MKEIISAVISIIKTKNKSFKDLDMNSEVHTATDFQGWSKNDSQD